MDKSMEIARSELILGGQKSGKSRRAELLALASHSQPQTLVVVDCLTLWLTNLLMPADNNEQNRHLAHDPRAQAAIILRAIEEAAGPVVLVGNEIGLGVIPLGRETRAFVDALGRLNQDVAQVCEHVTFMAAGLPLTLKGQP